MFSQQGRRKRLQRKKKERESALKAWMSYFSKLHHDVSTQAENLRYLGTNDYVQMCRRTVLFCLLCAVRRIVSSLPGKDAARITQYLAVAEFFRPECAVMTAGAFDKTTVHHNGFIFIRPQQSDIIILAFVGGFLVVPGFHQGDGKEKLFCPRNMVFLIAVLVWHGVDDQNILLWVHEFF